MSDSQTSDPAALLRDGLAASQRNDSETALELFSRVSKAAPAAAIPHLLAAAELAQLGRFDQAEAAYARALVLDPNLHIARYQLGLLQFTSEKVAMAMLTWQPLLELGQDHALSLFVQGFAQLAEDNFTEAANLFTEGMRRNTDNAPLNADIALIMERLASLTEATANAAPGQPDDGTAAEPDLGISAHVLLSNYRQGGRSN